MMQDRNGTLQEKARTTMDTIAANIERATDTPLGRTAQAVSESSEFYDSHEPMNSAKRMMLVAGAGVAMATSLMMQLTGRKHEALFFGLWVPTLLTVALWYQLVKAEPQQQSANAPTVNPQLFR